MLLCKMLFRFYCIEIENKTTTKTRKRRSLLTRKSKTANITKDDITLHHIAKMSLCSEGI